MAGSAVVAAKSALVNALAGRPGLADVAVSYAWPGDALERVALYLGNVTGRHDPAGMRAGRKSRDEEFVVEVFVEVRADGEPQEVADERAVAVAREVEDALADDPTLASSSLLWARVETYELRQSATTEGRWAGVRLGVRCRSRLA